MMWFVAGAECREFARGERARLALAGHRCAGLDGEDRAADNRPMEYAPTPLMLA
jgi:hypothetical protein